MDRSILEGDGLGGQDIAYFSIALFIFPYLLSIIIKPLRKKMKEIGIYKYCGFVLASAIVLVVMNRGFKAFFARERPGDALENPGLYSEMWMMWKQTLDDALSHGSFTSGHTTTAALMIIFAYISIRTQKTWVCVLTFTTSITFTVLMGFGRIVHGSHYPSDVLWATLTAILAIGWVYFSVLKIPQQEEGEFEVYVTNGEFVWSILALFCGIAILAGLLGIKYTIMDFEWYWPLAGILGPIIAYVLVKRMHYVLHGPEEQKNKKIASETQEKIEEQV